MEADLVFVCSMTLYTIGRILCILVVILNCVQVSGEVGGKLCHAENCTLHSAFNRRKVLFSGATWFFTSFQKREPKCKGWTKFALWKLPVCSYPVAQGA